MAWWEILVGIILFIVALGVLIGIHELGHLSAAKMFHVYCFNYSIGFGPKLISSKRTKKHETIWTLRAIPLGGFVSMYGEGAELDSDEYIPPSRSLEGIARYKRAIIISAGVFLNFILGLVLIFIHNAAFPHIYFYTNVMDTNDVPQTALVVSTTGEAATKVNDEDALKMTWDPVFKDANNNVSFAYIASDITISGVENKYVLVFTNSISSTKVDPDLTTSFDLYKQVTLEEMASTTKDKYNKDFLITAYAYEQKISIEEASKAIEDMTPEVRKNTYERVLPPYYREVLKIDSSIDVNTKYSISKGFPGTNVELQFYSKKDDGKYELNETKQTFALQLKDNGSGLKPIGVRCKRFTEEKGFNYITRNNIKYRIYGGEEFHKYDAQDLFSDTWNEWCGANTAVFRGLGMLFTGQGEVSGPIGIAKMSTTVLANFGFERYLYLWGMISCNLAILNLLPFPGLDGWALVVIAYEAIRKKQIPTKVKSIISVIGLGLLFLLMIFIIIKDVVGLIV